MRRLLTTVAIAATLLAGAACSSERGGVAGPRPTDSPPSSGAPSPGAEPTGSVPGGPTPRGGVPGATGAAGGNAAEVCAAAIKASTQSIQTYIAELGKSLQAAGANDAAGAKAAQSKAEAALNAWGAAMREQSAKATDAQLKALLAEIGVEVGTMKATVDSVDETKLDQLQQRLDQLCGS